MTYFNLEFQLAKQDLCLHSGKNFSLLSAPSSDITLQIVSQMVDNCREEELNF